MASQNLLELRDRPVIVKVIKVVKRREVLGVMRTVGERLRIRIRRSRHRLRGQQKYSQKNYRAAWDRKKQSALVQVNDFSLPEPSELTAANPESYDA